MFSTNEWTNGAFGMNAIGTIRAYERTNVNWRGCAGPIPSLKKNDSLWWSPQLQLQRLWAQDQHRVDDHVYIGCGPIPVTVTTRIITCLLGNQGDSYSRSLATVTGRGSHQTPRHNHKDQAGTTHHCHCEKVHHPSKPSSVLRGTSIKKKILYICSCKKGRCLKACRDSHSIYIYIYILCSILRLILGTNLTHLKGFPFPTQLQPMRNSQFSQLSVGLNLLHTTRIPEP